MTGVSIQLDLSTEVLAAALKKLAGASADMTPAMQQVGSFMETETLLRFEREQAPDGSKWPPSLRAKRTGGQTLTDTARLRQSIVSEATATTAAVGTNLVYAAIHQMGGTIEREARQQTIYHHYDKRAGELSRRFVTKGKSNFARDVQVKAHKIKIPARPFLGANEQSETGIAEILTDYLAAAAGGLAS